MKNRVPLPPGETRVTLKYPEEIGPVASKEFDPECPIYRWLVTTPKGVFRVEVGDWQTGETWLVEQVSGTVAA